MRGEVFFVDYNNDRCFELVVMCGRKVQLLSENTCNKLELIIYNSLKEQRIRLFNFVYESKMREKDIVEIYYKEVVCKIVCFQRFAPYISLL